MMQTRINSQSHNLSFRISSKGGTWYFSCLSVETESTPVIPLCCCADPPTSQCFILCRHRQHISLWTSFLWGRMNLQPHWFGSCIIYLGCGVTWFAADLTVVLHNLLLRLLSANGLGRLLCIWLSLNKDILPLPLPQPPSPCTWSRRASPCPVRIDELAMYCMSLEGKHWLQILDVEGAARWNGKAQRGMFTDWLMQWVVSMCRSTKSAETI